MHVKYEIKTIIGTHKTYYFNNIFSSALPETFVQNKHSNNETIKRLLCKKAVNYAITPFHPTFHNNKPTKNN